MAFLKQVGGGDAGMAVFVGTTDAYAPELTARSRGSFAFVTDPSTGKSTLTEFLNDENVSSEATGWAKWKDVK